MSFSLGPAALPPIRVALPGSRTVVVPLRGPRGPAGPPGSGSGDLPTVQIMIDTTVGTHVQDVDPHPAYDDLPSLALLFENGLV